MARIEKKFIKFGTGATEVNSRVIPANFTPTYYTPAQIAAEGNDKVSAHLKGIDNSLGGIVPSAGDISPTSYSNATDVVTNQAITSFSFANGVVRGFKALVTVTISATANLYATYELAGVQRGSDWILTGEYTGDNTQVTFDITSAGQLRYSKLTTAGHTDTTIKFRAQALPV